MGTREADEASRLMASLSDDEVGLNIDAIGNLAGAELYLDRYLSCREHAERGMRVARATGQGELVALLNPTLGTSLWVLGEFDRSAEILDAAVEGARLTKNAQAITWGAFNRAYGALMSGDVETAYALGEESVELSRDFTDGLISSHAGVVHCGDAAGGGRVRARDRRCSWAAPGARTCTASPPGRGARPTSRCWCSAGSRWGARRRRWRPRSACAPRPPRCRSRSPR